MKAAARLPSPFPSPPLLLLSIRPHIHTVVSPRNQRHPLYVVADLLSPAALHPVPTTVSQQANRHKKPSSAHGNERRVENRRQNWCHRGRLGVVTKCTSPVAPSKHPPFLIMSPRHRYINTHPCRQGNTLTKQQATPHFFATSGAAQRGNVRSYLVTKAHLSAPNLLALTGRHAHLE